MSRSIRRDKLVSFLDTYLDIDAFSDGSWNGLQVEGRDVVRRIMLTVDAGVVTFERAREERADFLIVHHGLYWKSDNPSLSGWRKTRVDLLCEAGISLYACHLPLDAHQEVGNNVQIVKLLGARPERTFAPYNGKEIGCVGILRKPASLTDVEQRLTRELNAGCTVLPFGRKTIRTIGAVSGGAGYGDLQQAIDQGLDLYITGEAHEFHHLARDAKINIIFAGHHATETTGVRALAAVLRRKLRVDAEFVDVPTGL